MSDTHEIGSLAFRKVSAVPTEKTFSIYQVAELLKAAPAEVISWIRQGRLTCRQLGAEPIRISQSQLVEFLRKEGVNVEAMLARAGIASAPEAVPVGPPISLREAVAAAPPPASYSLAASAPDEPAVPAATSAGESSAAESPAAGPSSPAEQEAVLAAISPLAGAILRDAVSRRATALHLDCIDGQAVLRLRIDGFLQDKAGFNARFPKAMVTELVREFKALVDPAASAAGVFHRVIEGRILDFRLVASPLAGGEKIVIHIRDPHRPPAALAELNLSGPALRQVRALLAAGPGLVLVAGLPGGAKQPLLQAIKNELVRRAALLRTGQSLRSIEDGTAPATPGVLATHAEDQSDVERVLRRMADQDADAIVVDDLPGEAMAAALGTARQALVVAGVTVLGGRDAVERLRGADPNPWPAAWVLRGLVVPARVRRNCPHCRQAAPAADELLDLAGLPRERVAFATHAGAGCEHCHGSGVDGSLLLANVIDLTGELGRLIREGAEDSRLVAAVRRQGVRTLLEDCLDLVRQGAVPLTELARISPLPAW